jgi:hypothetical protein
MSPTAHMLLHFAAYEHESDDDRNTQNEGLIAMGTRVELFSVVANIRTTSDSPRKDIRACPLLARSQKKEKTGAIR